MDARLAGLIASLPSRQHDGASADLLDGTAPPGGSFLKALRNTGIIWRLCALLSAHAAQTLLVLASWVAVGYGALSGHPDHGWLLAWALCLITTIPLRLSTTWLEGVISIGVGGLLKERLLAGSMTIDSDWMRRQGAGQLLGQVIEAENIDRLGTSGGLMTLLATVDLALVLWVFARGAAPVQQIAVFAVWVAVVAVVAVRNTIIRLRWTRIRLGLTYRLAENMTGHRTRLAQLAPEEWHTQEDAENLRYLDSSRQLDRTSAWLAAVASRGYLVVAVLAFAPAFIGATVPATQLAITIGAMLFSYGAFSRFAFGGVRLGAAWVSWQCVKPLFQAVSNSVQPGIHSGVPSSTEALLDAQEVVFAHNQRTEPVLKSCNLRVQPGDFLLLEGASGSGKSTFAALLAGLRQPSSGLILAGGLDWRTLGEEGWRKRIVCAPQYHENHIMAASLGFNLLMGRPYPHSTQDLADAGQVCRELGLGSLLERMPGGLDQMVGETGWQLSHGERSRVFLARALLQGGQALLLDETFAALDPDNMRLCLECVFRRAKTLLVIAHP